MGDKGIALEKVNRVTTTVRSYFTPSSRALGELNSLDTQEDPTKKQGELRDEVGRLAQGLTLEAGSRPLKHGREEKHSIAYTHNGDKPTWTIGVHNFDAFGQN